MKPTKKAASPAPSRASQGPESNGRSFEQAIQRLEKIVADMEGAELPLEDVLKKYEEGTRLVGIRSQELEEAEKTIEILTNKDDGTGALRRFESKETGETE